MSDAAPDDATPPALRRRTAHSGRKPATRGRTPAPAPVLVALSLAFLLLPTGAVGQATPLLRPHGPASVELERLVAWGLVDSAFVGHRPWSVAEARRLLAEARARIDRDSLPEALATTVRATLERAERAVGARAPAPGPSLASLRADLTRADMRPRVTPDNGLGSSSALIAPLVAYEGGRVFHRGTTAGFEATVDARPVESVALSVTPRLRVHRTSGGEFDADVVLQQAYVRAIVGNAALVAGRVPAVWGQGLHGGLLLSGNARPLLQVGISTARPVRLPGALGGLGPGEHRLFVAELGTEGRAFDHALLIGWRSSFRLHPRLEVGVAALNQQGGEGAPGASVLQRVADVLFLPNLMIPTRDFLFSQKMLGLDARLRLPGDRGVEAWLEMVIDDFDHRRLGGVLLDDAGWLVGLRVARLDEAGRLGLAVEAQHTGVRFYTHADFAGGVTFQRHFLGSALGTDADGVYARLEWRHDDTHELRLEGAWELRSNDGWRLELGGGERGFHKTAYRPEETRWRLVARWTRHTDRRRGWLRGEAGWERTDGFGFVEGASDDAFVVRVVWGRGG